MPNTQTWPIYQCTPSVLRGAPEQVGEKALPRDTHMNHTHSWRTNITQTKGPSKSPITSAFFETNTPAPWMYLKGEVLVLSKISSCFPHYRKEVSWLWKCLLSNRLPASPTSCPSSVCPAPGDAPWLTQHKHGSPVPFAICWLSQPALWQVLWPKPDPWDTKHLLGIVWKRFSSADKKEKPLEERAPLSASVPHLCLPHMSLNETMMRGPAGAIRNHETTCTGANSEQSIVKLKGGKALGYWWLLAPLPTLTLMFGEVNVFSAWATVIWEFRYIQPKALLSDLKVMET